MSYVDVASWMKKWNSAEVQILKVSKETLKEVGVQLFSKIVSYTPVGNPAIWKFPYVHKGYQPGTLKKSWAIGITPDVITISNDQPYAQRVENGWSTQAPYGMMRLGIADFPQLLEQISKKYKI